MKRNSVKISVTEGTDFVTMKVEGRIVGPFVDEFSRAWQSLAHSLNSRKLAVDLCGVTFIDAAGRRVLAEIGAVPEVEFRADSPMTKYFAEEARGGIRKNGQ